MNAWCQLIKRLIRLIHFMMILSYEIMVASLYVAVAVINPRYQFKAGIVIYPLDCNNALQMTLLANIITLTPGTLALELSPSAKYMIIHTMFLNDKQALIEHLKQTFEHPIMEIVP